MREPHLTSRRRSATTRARRRATVRLLLLVSLVSLSRGANAQSDPMAEYRERFKTGLAHYQAGSIGEALQYWEPVYRELGPERGWRLAFNLARAYEGLGDITRAVERYDAFLAQVELRRSRGETLEELIVREEKETRERLRDIAATKARITVSAGPAPIAVKIDGSEPRLAGFTAYVAPGKHTVVFDPGGARETRREVEISAGESATLTPPLEEPLPQRPTATPPIAPTPGPPRAIAPTTERPFSPVVLYVAGGLTLVSTLAPVLTAMSVSDFKSANPLSRDPVDPSKADAADPANAQKLEDYDARKTAFYATLAIPLTLAAGTAALTTWYFLGSRERVPPDVGAARHATRVLPPVVVATPAGGFAAWAHAFW